MLQYILSLQVPFLHLETFTTSVTLAIAIPPFSIALPMHLHGNCLGFPFSRRRQKTRKNDRKRTSTGRLLIPRRRTEWDAGVDVTRISATWKAKKAAVSQSGWKLQEASHRHERPERFGNNFFAFESECIGWTYCAVTDHDAAKGQVWEDGYWYLSEMLHAGAVAQCFTILLVGATNCRCAGQAFGDVAKWNMNTGVSGKHVSLVLVYVMDMFGVQDYCIKRRFGCTSSVERGWVQWKM